MTVYGYARVSTNGQDLALQEEALRAAGCTKIFAEKKSGARSDRPKLMRLLDVVDQGDAVIVTRLDRLARSSLDLLHTIDRISKSGASFRSLADTWCDTTTPHGKLILTVLAGLAEFRAQSNYGPHASRHREGTGVGCYLRTEGQAQPAATAHNRRALREGRDHGEVG